jgi:hypothetical protein
MTGLVVLMTVAVAAALGAMVVAVTSWRRSLDARLVVADGELRRLADSAAYRDGGAVEVRREIAAFREALAGMQVREEERRAREDETWQTLHRVASVLAGGQRTGRAGENVLRDALTHLPPSMVVTDFRVNGRVVEFGLVLPDGRRLPVDSKWTSDRELQLLARTEDPDERERLIRAVEAEVARRAREVAGYLDPAVTAPLAVAAVPDAAYAVLRRAHAEAYRRGVVVIGYSLAMPFLLFLYGVMARLGTEVDARACLADLATVLDAMEGTLENKVARAAAMLVNGSEEFRGQLGKARSAVARGTAGERIDRSPELVGQVDLPGVVFGEEVIAGSPTSSRYAE